MPHEPEHAEAQRGHTLHSVHLVSSNSQVGTTSFSTMETSTEDVGKMSQTPCSSFVSSTVMSDYFPQNSDIQSHC